MPSTIIVPEDWRTADPDAIVRDINEALSSIEAAPNTIIMRWSLYVAIVRSMMRKRAFRRWRGKMKAERRRQLANA